MMDEFSFIETIKQSTYKQSTLIKGIGDDGAVFRNRSSDIVTCVDTFVESVHFSSKTMSFFHVGYKCLAVNISDLCAMGATPTFYLVSIVIPESVTNEELTELYDGLHTIASNFRMDLIGGDTVSGEQLIITVTAIGYVPAPYARYRSDAKVGDYIFVTGTLGDAQAGLEILLHNLDVDHKEYFVTRHRMPKINVDFIKNLRTIKRMVLNDISDGLANELNEIAESSCKTLLIEDAKVPLHRYIKQFPKEKYEEWKYYAGEDFELVGTVAKKDWDTVVQCAEEHDITVTKIGEVIDDPREHGSVFMRKNNELIRLDKKGYRHQIGK